MLGGVAGLVVCLGAYLTAKYGQHKVQISDLLTLNDFWGLELDSGLSILWAPPDNRHAESDQFNSQEIDNLQNI